jgi:hypothetical protein
MPRKSEVSPQAPLALSEAEEFAEKDAMEVVEPASHADSAPPSPTHCPAPMPPYVPSDRAATFLSLHPFPQVLDHPRIVSWACDAITNGVLFDRIAGIAEWAGHNIVTFILLYVELLPQIKCILQECHVLRSPPPP